MSDRLSLQHQKDVATVAGGVTSVIVSAALGADPVAISTWFFGAVDGMVARISAGYAINRNSAMHYLPQHARLSNAAITAVPGSLDVGALRARLHITGPVAFKTSIDAGQDTERALRNMATQMGGVADEAVRNGDRDVITQTVMHGRGVVGWRRRLSGRSCGFCSMLASRGAVYYDRKTATIAKDGAAYHPHCHCWAEPLYQTKDEPPEVKRLQRQWQRVTAGQSGEAAKQRAWRRHWEQRPAAAGPGRPTGPGGVPAPHTQIPIRPELERAFSTPQVSRAFEAEARRITGSDIPADFDGSVSTAREHAEGLLLALERFPEADLHRVTTGRTIGAAYAEHEHGVITFDREWSSVLKRDEYLDRLARDVQSRYHPPGLDSPAGIAIHEFGHVIDQETIGEIARLEIKQTVRRAAVDASSSSGAIIRYDVSRYAVRDGRELAAEAFADVMLNGQSASLLSRDIYAILERHYSAGGRVLRSTGRGIVSPAGPDLSRMTVPQLRAMAAQRGVAIPAGARKADIVRLLGEGGEVRAPLPVVDRYPLAPGYRGPTAAARQRQREEILTLTRDAPDSTRGWQGAPREHAEALESLGYLRTTRSGEFTLTDKGRAYFEARPAPVPTVSPLAKRPVAELRAMARQRGLTIPPRSTKAQIVEILEAPPPTAAELATQQRIAASLTGRQVQAASRVTRLSETQRKALDRYGGDGGYVINIDLRDRAGRIDLLTAKNRQSVEALDSVFARSLLPRDAVLYRRERLIGGPFGDLANADRDLTGFTWTDVAYSSTSIAERLTGPRAVQIRIFAPGGTRAISHQVLDSDEVLLDRGTTFRVIADHGKNSRFDRVIDIEIVPKPAPTAAELQRAATRAKFEAVQQAKGTSALLAEIDELIANKATKATIRQRLDPALTAPEQIFAGADPAVVSALADALATGDMAKLRSAVTRLGTKAKIKPISRAGAKVAFDPDTMESVGPTAIEAGTRVTVVRRGASVTLPDGSTVQLTKAQVTPIVKPAR